MGFVSLPSLRGRCPPRQRKKEAREKRKQQARPWKPHPGWAGRGEREKLGTTGGSRAKRKEQGKGDAGFLHLRN